MGTKHLILQPEAVVRTNPDDARRGTLTVGDTSWPCALGRAGVRLDKREGDGATPIGTWPIRQVLYRADRLSAHGLEMPSLCVPVRRIAPDDGWCDAPLDENYNRRIMLPYAASAERMWREDGVYDVVVVLGHNDDPPVADMGSAIFMHVAQPGLPPTEGCIALELAHLMAVLQLSPAIQAVRVTEN